MTVYYHALKNLILTKYVKDPLLLLGYELDVNATHTFLVITNHVYPNWRRLYEHEVDLCKALVFAHDPNFNEELFQLQYELTDALH